MYKVKDGAGDVVVANGDYPSGIALKDASQEVLAALMPAVPELIKLESPAVDGKTKPAVAVK